ncbi:unnamed protein product [Miscanthus lutarioriparius]|uniref:PNPLA domain-containing protein n=1 Tax=Miscanthus lutarioriparius TaxID=422564 RepID=A0A811SRJ9_9POAL|nr:unnamed protein product [Miscanthus lutarioriparius]
MPSPQTKAMGVVDRLSYEIFSLLESKFLFGGGGGAGCLSSSGPGTPARAFLDGGRVRVLSIDGCGGAGAEDALLAAAALARLEAGLREQAGDPDARVADFFDVVAGAGAGAVLAAMLFLRGADGRPRYTAQEALAFVASSVGRKEKNWGGRRGRDTVAPLLVPCYDLATGAPFVFSRADAVESDSLDFRLRDVCAATGADRGALADVRSVDGLTAIAAACAGVAAMGNPAAAAVTHVLHNKLEFPLATSVEDILVFSIGTGSSTTVSSGPKPNTPVPPTRAPSPRELARVTDEGVADMVDESVAMAFGDACGSNYVRIQAGRKSAPLRAETAVATAEAMLAQRNVESVLFRGRRLSERTNAEKVDTLVTELVKEQERRRSSPFPNVAIKQVATPRLSSATTASSGTTTARTTSSMPSPASWDSRR